VVVVAEFFEPLRRRAHGNAAYLDPRLVIALKLRSVATRRAGATGDGGSTPVRFETTLDEAVLLPAAFGSLDNPST
jgi:hypothetical protein